jgi:cytochrome P450
VFTLGTTSSNSGETSARNIHDHRYETFPRMYLFLTTSFVDKDDSKLSIDHLTKMKFLPQILQETLRLYATVPYVTRTANQTVQIKDGNVNITIPEGTNLLIPLYLINRDPDLWAMPSKFDPDRFNGQSCYFQSSKVAFFPFGFGSSQCIGSLLAQIEISVLMVHLMKRYRLSPEPNYKVGLKTGLSLSPSNGVRVQIERIPN